MKKDMENDRSKLQRMLEQQEPTQGMYVRVYGDHLIIGREEPEGPQGQMTKEDRVRFTRLGSSRYGLSVMRHTGRWERTPFSGSMKEMVEIVLGLMQHLVAPY